MLEKIQETANFLKGKMHTSPKTAIILGTGLGSLANEITEKYEIEYKDIPNFPVSTVEGHSGKLIFGKLGNKDIMAMQGRFHYYEGYSMTEVVRPIRLMKLLGAEVLFLTNAAGGIQLGMKAGDLMLLTGQIASFVPSPLIGENIEELGPRFPDMSRIYDYDLQKIAKKCAAETGADLKEGTYLQFTGPAYESPQEVAMARTLGADAVGMSTACEAVAANHMGMRIVGISCISNLACGISPQPLSHKEVQEAADAVAPVFQKLVTQMIKEIGTTCR